MSVKDRARSMILRTVEPRFADYERQLADLERAVAENRRLNERLSDVLDVVTELLVPAVDRDDVRLQEALGKLGKVV